MTSPLLQTKLRRPALRPVRVERPALYARLTTGQLQKLTLVVAPAGFGKTALVSGWLGERPAGWLALDGADNEPARFWRYLIAALQTLAAPVGVTALAMLGANPPPPPEALLTSLVNDLAAGDGPLCLILDDYHLIENPAIHDALAFFIEHMPARLHLVLLSRSDPPLPLAGWRASGQLQELRQADLCFSLAEAAEFLNEVMGLALMPAQVEQLAERTEGWVAGLQLAALSLQGHKDPTAFVAAFSGSHRFVMDYLLDEVLLRQSEPVRRFLLQTSILNRLTAGLCAAVTGRSDSAAVLAELERANLFILPLDDERRWYRYHQLFADLLRARLLDEDEATGLHQRAARWLAAEGRTAEAINHWLAAEDFAAAAALIEEAGFAALYQGELGQLAGWLAALPPVWAAERPWLGILAGWTALLTGRFPAVAAAVGAAQSRLAAAGDRQGEAAGHLAAIQAYLALMTGDVAAALQNARAALAQLPAGDAATRSVVTFTLAGAALFADEVGAAQVAFAEAAQAATAAGNIHLAVPALCALGTLQQQNGQMTLAETSFRAALRLATGPAESLLPLAAGALNGLGQLAYERDELDEAENHLQTARTLAAQWGNVESLVSSLVHLAQLALARGAGDLALTHLDAAATAERDGQLAPSSTAWLTAAQIRVRLALGQPAAAREIATARGLTTDLPPSYMREVELLALARLMVAEEDWGGAAALLNRLLAAAEGRGQRGRASELLAWLAVCHEAQGETELGRIELDQALALGAVAGLRRTFLDVGPRLRPLLARAAARGCQPDYVAALLAENRPVATPSLQPPTAPLNETEKELLRLIAAGLSNGAAAAELFLSVNTVKWHLKNIYAKLGVHSRVEAVLRARELANR